MNRYAMTLAVLALAGCSKAPDTTMVSHDLQTMGSADPQGGPGRQECATDRRVGAADGISL